jgi:peptide deformylase
VAKREIKTYGNEILKNKTVPVTEFDKDLKKLIDDMLETLYSHNGAGLAANQIGELKRIVVIDTGPREENSRLYILINPEITEKSKETLVAEEGCLSFPEIFEKIERSAKVKVRAQDINAKNIEFEAEGLLARVCQHEIDHINGVLFIERMTPVRRMLHSKKLRELKKLNKSKK